MAIPSLAQDFFFGFMWFLQTIEPALMVLIHQQSHQGRISLVVSRLTVELHTTSIYQTWMCFIEEAQSCNSALILRQQ